MSERIFSARKRAMCGLLTAAVSLYAGSATAQSFSERLVFHADLGLGEAMPDVSVSPVIFNTPTFSGSLNARLGVHLTQQVSLHVVGGVWNVFGRGGMTPHPNVGLGFRIGDTVANFFHPFVMVEAGPTFSLAGPKPWWQATAGLEFMLSPRIGLGPFIRYAYETRTNNDTDRAGWLAGASFTFRTPWPQPVVAAPPADQDSDGVIDTDDQCPTVAQGTTPDPARRGCPREDNDHDGIYNDEDQCVDVAQGDHPDPARRGCPAGDADSDGVLDPDDQCVNEAQGEHPDPARLGCPDADADADGVFNAQDQCRDVPAGDSPDPDRLGCPIPDRDGDSVPDAVDRCPDQPGSPRADPARNGCPGIVTVSQTQLTITQQIFFASNSDRILPQSTPVLVAVSEALVATPRIHRISVDGHTDDVGNDARNLDLSQRRAAAVVAWLSSHGVAADRLEPHGFGETRPLQPVEGLRARALTDARSRNRRVEFNIVDPAPRRPGAAAVTTPAPAAPAAAPATP
ncbi:MAG: OmpA family protein [Deltaproteobacteria bacterium]|nr:OmpA family protein [Deltaproteobacteria bacterium]